jgi:hypothetical protein
VGGSITISVLTVESTYFGHSAVHCPLTSNYYMSLFKQCPVPVIHHFNYLLTYDSYGPVHNRFHRGECITWASGGEGAMDTLGPLNGIERITQLIRNQQPSVRYIMLPSVT